MKSALSASSAPKKCKRKVHSKPRKYELNFWCGCPGILQLDPEIPIKNARKIVDLRNFVIHGYDKVDNVIIWGVVSKDLPKLKKEVDVLMNQFTLL